METITEDLIFDLASTSQGLLKVSETGKLRNIKKQIKVLMNWQVKLVLIMYSKQYTER